MGKCNFNNQDFLILLVYCLGLLVLLWFVVHDSAENSRRVLRLEGICEAKGMGFDKEQK